MEILDKENFNYCVCNNVIENNSIMLCKECMKEFNRLKGLGWS